MIAPVSILIMSIVRDRGVFFDVMPMWLHILKQLSLVVAGAIVIAGVAAGLVAWKRERRYDA